MNNMVTPDAGDTPRFRSGAVARMMKMPVSTLRIWERRYRVVAPPQTGSGHRLYSPADVERLLLIKQLVDLGHAIGSIAALDTPALLAIAERRAELDHAPGRPGTAAPRRVMAVVLGMGLAHRLGSRRLQRVGVWADLAAAERALAGADADAVPTADLLVAELATLQPETADRLVAVMQRLGVRRSVVVYGFGTEAAAERLRAAGCEPRRAPLPDAELRALVDDAVRLLTGEDMLAPMLASEVPARLFHDEALARLAARSSAVACECPRHLAELVHMLAAFETYSGECRNRHAADAALHAELQRVAGTARAMFENALVHVAEAEGLDWH